MSDLLPPLSLYVHIPWCIKKCPYCDFNSHELATPLPERAYIEALIADLDADLDQARGRRLESIFIGGGTPSLVSAAGYRRLLDAIGERLALAPEIEITLEANPGTFERERFRGFRRAGINRLSLGVQSFSDRALDRLGRIHGREDAIRAAGVAREVGFDELNIDLMHGLPGQSEAAALDDIDQALALAPSHLSWYQLTLEPNTAFYSQPPVLPDEDVLAAIAESGQARLEAAGFERYEISAWALPDRASRHNLNYWRFGDYLGIGAGAHAKISRWQEGGALSIRRCWKTRQPQAYLERCGDSRGFAAGAREIVPQERGLEFLMNALRLTEGVPRSFWQRTGLADARLEAQMAPAIARELASLDAERLAATPLGLLFLNDLLALCDEEILARA